MLPKAQGCVGPALGRYGIEEVRSRGFRKTGDMSRLTKVAPCFRHAHVFWAPEIKRCRDRGGNLGVPVHELLLKIEVSHQKQKKLAPDCAGSELLCQDLQCHAPSGGVALRERRTFARCSYVEDVMSSSCSMVTLHNNPFREPTGSAAGSRIGSTSAVLPRRGPLRELHMVPGSNGVQRALIEAQRGRVLRAEEGSVRRKHLAQEISTLVANQSARAQLHDFEKEMDSLGSQVRCVDDARCERIVAQPKCQESRKAREFGTSFSGCLHDFVAHNSLLREILLHMEHGRTFPPSG